jgi:hypothetical protein
LTCRFAVLDLIMQEVVVPCQNSMHCLGPGVLWPG